MADLVTLLSAGGGAAVVIGIERAIAPMFDKQSSIINRRLDSMEANMAALHADVLRQSADAKEASHDVATATRENTRAMTDLRLAITEMITIQKTQIRRNGGGP